MQELANKIKDLRKENQLTMEMLVEDMKSKFPDIKIDKSMISRWERNESSPSLIYVKCLSEYFNVSADYLVGLTDVRVPCRLLVNSKRR